MKIVPSTAYVTETGVRVDVHNPPAADASGLPAALNNRTARAGFVTQPVLEEGRAIASPDFSVVVWHGRRFSFTPMQAAVIAELWHARVEGYESVGTAHLLAEAGSDTDRLRNLFRGHEAWGTLIQLARQFGGSPGTYRLAAGPV